MTEAQTVDHIWIGDTLDRRADAELLIDFLSARTFERGPGAGAYVLNLNTGWGSGKTFFLHRLKQHLELTGHLASYVDAWQDDDAGEPLVAVMAAIDSTLQPYLKKRQALETLWDTALAAGGQAAALALKGAAYQGAKRLLGPGLDQLANLTEEVQADQLEDGLASGAADGVHALASKFLRGRLEDYRKHRSSTDSFKMRVARVLTGLADLDVKRPYFILIDELDRCRPTYAVEMLEQVKHLFDIDGVCFVFATDGLQLAHSVRAVYGATFDGDTYLRRFFNRSYRFQEPSRTKYVEFLTASAPIDVDSFSLPPNETFVSFVGSGCEAYKLSLRDIDQVFDQVRTFSSLWNRNAKIELAFLLPLIVASHLGRPEFESGLVYGNLESVPKHWTVKVENYDTYRGQSLQKSVSVASLLDRLNQAFASVDGVAQKDPPDSGADRWFWERMREEIRTEYRGQFLGSRSTRPTILKQYPAMVMNLKRLSEAPDIR